MIDAGAERRDRLRTGQAYMAEEGRAPRSAVHAHRGVIKRVGGGTDDRTRQQEPHHPAGDTGEFPTESRSGNCSFTSKAVA